MKPVRALGRGSVATIVRWGVGVAWIMLWIIAVACIVSAAGYAVAAVMAASGGLDPQWLHERSQYIRLNDGTIENYNGPDWLLVYSTLSLASVTTAGALVIVWRLRKLFDSFLSDQPFRRENANHLRVIWITMLIVEAARLALLALVGVLIRVLGGPNVEGHSSGGEFNITAWASILILIVLAEVFREGARLKEEEELTI